MRSLRTRLFAVWTLSLAASISVGVLLVQLYQQSDAALLSRADAELARNCDQIGDSYTYYTSGWSGPVPGAADPDLQRDLAAVVAIGLSDTGRARGGILRDPADIDPPTDLSQLATAALATDRVVTRHAAVAGHTEVSAACRLPGPIANLAAWVATDLTGTPGYTSLTGGLAVLAGLVLVLSGGLTWLVVTWLRHIGRIETALARQDAQGGLPRIAPTGEVELDRIIAALNEAGQRLREAQNATQEAAGRAALAERMAALGRVAAGVAHEIRNPIGAMRLRAESALAHEAEPGRTRVALGAIIGQIDRLDRLSGELLAMTQRGAAAPVDVELAPFLAACAHDHARDGIAIRVLPIAGVFRFDPAMIRRALDNLVQNAVRHTPPGGSVTISASIAMGLAITVADTGPGVAPELRDTLFEPFVTSRADGTGLGLAIAREMVQAHGGTLTLQETATGAAFTLSLPEAAE